METTKNLQVPNGAAAFQFFHLGVEYAIWAWREDTAGDVDQIILSRVIPENGGFGVSFDQTYVSAEEAYRNGLDIKTYMKDVVIPHFNEHLLAKGGGTSEGFPLDASNLEQYEWLITQALTYSVGKLHINF